MKKTYVLDTNVLLHDPHAIKKFEDNDLILPIYVIEEIDQFKRESNERGRNARAVVRLLDALREAGGSLSQGVPVGEGGSLRVYVPEKRPELAIALNPSSGDHAIIANNPANGGGHGIAIVLIAVSVDENGQKAFGRKLECEMP